MIFFAAILAIGVTADNLQICVDDDFYFSGATYYGWMMGKGNHVNLGEFNKGECKSFNDFSNGGWSGLFVWTCSPAELYGIGIISATLDDGAGSVIKVDKFLSSSRKTCNYLVGAQVTNYNDIDCSGLIMKSDGTTAAQSPQTLCPQSAHQNDGFIDELMVHGDPKNDIDGFAHAPNQYIYQVITIIAVFISGTVFGLIITLCLTKIIKSTPSKTIHHEVCQQSDIE